MFDLSWTIEAQMEKETKRYEKRLRKNVMMKTEEAGKRLKNLKLKQKQENTKNLFLFEQSFIQDANENVILVTYNEIFGSVRIKYFAHFLHKLSSTIIIYKFRYFPLREQ